MKKMGKVMRSSAALTAVSLVATTFTGSYAYAEGPKWFNIFKRDKKVATQAPQESDVKKAPSTRDLIVKKTAEREYTNSVIKKITENNGNGNGGNGSGNGNGDLGPSESDFSFLSQSGLEGIAITYGSKHFLYNGKTLDEFLFQNEQGNSIIADNGWFKTASDKAGLNGAALVDAQGNPITITSKSGGGLLFKDVNGNALSIASQDGVTYYNANGSLADLKTMNGTDFVDSAGNPVDVVGKSKNGLRIRNTNGTISEITTKKGVTFVDSKGRVVDAAAKAAPGTQLSAVQAVLYAAAIQYFAEAPALGGNPLRGFQPIIWPTMVRLAFENRLVMLPSGELLFPADSEFKYMVTGEQVKTASRADLMKAHVVVTDSKGNVVGENFQPIQLDAFEDVEGNAVLSSDAQEEMDEYSKGLSAFNNLFGAMTLNSRLDMSFYNQRQADIAKMDKIMGPHQSWLGCMGKLFRGMLSKQKRMEARECFQLNKDQAMAAALNPDLEDTFVKDLLVGVGRGAASGFGVSAILGGMDLGSGAALGAFMNGLRIIYNRFWKKEVISAEQMRKLHEFVDKYTFAPNSYGEVLPKKGLWMVRDGQTIIRYQTRSMFVRDRVTGKTSARTGAVLLDINGNPRAKDAGWNLDNRSMSVRALGRDNPEDEQRQREAIKQIQKLSEIQEAKRPLVTPASETPNVVSPNVR